nr:PREDICTED: alpha-1-inhibitor 3-like [Latimeria chalumnae]|eukprot:XP_006008170.1 PREDICTED: alpha-1-inhibitor 3-like [Latimeria chalumnae]
MWQKTFLSCFLLQLASTGPVRKPTFMVMIPSETFGGSTEEVCVDLANLNETLKINLVLVYGAESMYLLEQEIQVPDWYQCIPFKVPKVNEDTMGSLEVCGVGDTYQFQESKTVLIKKLGSDYSKFQL